MCTPELQIGNARMSGQVWKQAAKNATLPPDSNKHLAKLASGASCSGNVATNPGAVDLFINSPSCRDILQTTAQPFLGLPSAVNGERYSLWDTKLGKKPSPSPLFRARWIRQQLTVCSASPPRVSLIAKCCWWTLGGALLHETNRAV